MVRGALRQRRMGVSSTLPSVKAPRMDWTTSATFLVTVVATWIMEKLMDYTWSRWKARRRPPATAEAYRRRLRRRFGYAVFQWTICVVFVALYALAAIDGARNTETLVWLTLWSGLALYLTAVMRRRWKRLL